MKRNRDFLGNPAKVSDKEVNLLRNRVRCSLCGKRYFRMEVTYATGNVTDFVLHYNYNYSFPEVEPHSRRCIYRSSLVADPVSYRKMMQRRRFTIEAGSLSLYSPYDRMPVRLVCKCGGWRCLDVKFRLKPVRWISNEKPFWGV